MTGCHTPANHAVQVADDPPDSTSSACVANQRLDDLRRRTPNDTLGHRGRKDDPLYRIRRLLTAAPMGSRSRRMRGSATGARSACVVSSTLVTPTARCAQAGTQPKP